MRVCLVYDCLFPWTIGGAERWYRNLAERLVEDGHEVTYLTLRQWNRSDPPHIPGVSVVAVGPRMKLYAGPGRRRIAPPLVFGLGVLWHLMRHGRRYDVVHTASFPYFSLLAAAVVRALSRGRYRLIVDWHEVWSLEYWQEYLGRVGGRAGWRVQLACARVRQSAFCFSQLHATRLSHTGLRGDITVLRGEYAGSLSGDPAAEAEPLVVFAGRLIPEKRVELSLAGVAVAARRLPELRAVFYGDGPERQRLEQLTRELGLVDVVRLAGFAPSDEVEADMRRALCVVVSSRREGYGMVIVEASARATPCVVVAGDDSAATELIEDGANGVVVHEADAEAVGAAIVRVATDGIVLRERTADWFRQNGQALSLDGSLGRVLSSYAGAAPSTRREQAAVHDVELAA